jgi:hypothetical protein
MVIEEEAAMEKEKQRRGRPQKKKDSVEPWQFARTAQVTCAYDEARERGEKHSVAVREAVEFVKRRNPEMPISETEVRRILASCRPRGSRTVLRFERKNLTEEELNRHRWILEQVALLQRKKGLKVELPKIEQLTKMISFLTIRLAERPDYPRHNRKYDE